MKILLLGKNGQLGHEILKQGNFYHNISLKGYDRDELDVLDFIKVKKTVESQKPDVIINTTAYHVVLDCEKHPEKAFASNAFAVLNLARTCNEYGICLVTYSTDYVFDGSKGGAYEEDDVPNPLQIYGLSKFIGEKICLNYHPNSLVIRTCGVYGGKKGSRSKKGNFVLQILAESDKLKEIEVAKEQIISPTYAGDLARATFQLINGKASPGIYHLVNEGYCSWAEFAQKIVKLAKKKCKIIPVDRGCRSGEMKKPRLSALKNTKAGKMNIILSHWSNGLKKYLNSLKGE